MADEAVEDAGQANPVKWALIALGSIIGLVGLCLLMMNMGRLGGDGLTIDPNRVGDIAHGQKIYSISCATCHGAGGKGLPHQGAPLAGSNFVITGTERQLMQMIKIGRTTDDPKSVMKLPMPAKGGYATLTDADLQDVVTYIKSFNAKAQK